MSPLDESLIRSELHQAVAVLDPLPPPFPTVMARGRRRRRTRRAVAGVVIAAAVVVAVVAVVVIAPGGPGGRGSQRIVPAAPTPPLRAYARQHGGAPVKHSRFSLDWVAGPVRTATGRYGAFVTDSDLVVVKVVRGRWTSQAKVSLNQGPPRFRLGVEPGPVVPGGIPTFIARTEGGDVAYAAGVAVHFASGWRFAKFGLCGRGNCPPGSTQESYLRMTHTGLISQQDDCTPDCAAGTEYLIGWQWNVAKQGFEPRSVTVQQP
jgi:hypothetical protein